MQSAQSARPGPTLSSSHGATAGPGESLTAVWTGAREAVACYVERKQALAELYSMDNLMLKDIGIPRCGIAYAVAHGRG